LFGQNKSQHHKEEELKKWRRIGGVFVFGGFCLSFHSFAFVERKEKEKEGREKGDQRSETRKDVLSHIWGGP